MVDEQHPVEMVDLMLQADRQQPVDLAVLDLAVGVPPARAHPIGAQHLGILLGDRQAALLVGHQGFALLEDLRIDEHPRVPDRLALLILFLLEVDHEQADRYPDLHRGQPDAGRVVHRLEHVGDEGLELGIEILDRSRGLAQDRIGNADDRKNGHRAGR